MPLITWNTVLDGDGHVEWRNEKNQFHRLDGPALIEADGAQHWALNGEYHREDGPAMIWANGRQEWFRRGRCHRMDGPAIIDEYGNYGWYLNDDRICSREEFQRRAGLSDEEMALLILKYGDIK